MTPRILIFAGPNGAGKTTFAREYLPNEAGVRNFRDVYRTLVDEWRVYDNTGAEPILIEGGSNV